MSKYVKKLNLQEMFYKTIHSYAKKVVPVPKYHIMKAYRGLQCILNLLLHV